MGSSLQRVHQRQNNFIVVAKDLPRHWGPYGKDIFLWLLSRANERKSAVRFKGRRFWLPAGGLPIGWETTAEVMGISKNTLKKYVRMFAEEGMTKLLNDNRGTLIIFKNYVKYQSLLKSEGHAEGQPMTPQISHSLLNSNEAKQELPKPNPKPPHRPMEVAAAAQSEPTEPKRELQPYVPEGFLKIWNEHRPDTHPPISEEYLPAKTAAIATKLWTKKPDIDYWTAIVRRMAKSLWITGQVPWGGEYFDLSTGFCFLVRRHELIAAGEYDKKGWGTRIIPIKAKRRSRGLHNVTDTTHCVERVGKQASPPVPVEIFELQRQETPNVTESINFFRSFDPFFRKPRILGESAQNVQSSGNEWVGKGGREIRV